jgi:peptide/nickel transport system substrate-binding protein
MFARQRRALAPFAVALLAVGVLAVLGATPMSTAAQEERTLRVATVQEFDSINPHLSFIGSSAEAMILNYDVLVGFDPDLDYAPTGFAESWTQDGASWTFTIRQGMRWSDGRPADASDVAFTFQYLLASMDPTYQGPWAPDGNDAPGQGQTRGDGRADNPLSLYGDVLVNAVGLQSVQLVDDRTVVLTTVTPTTLILGAYVPILPEHIWLTVTFAQANTDFQTEPPVVGSGPFQIVEWERGSSARFVRNEHYWGKRPFLDEVVFRFFDDQPAMAEALRAGEVDYVRGVRHDQFDALDAEADIVGTEGQGAGYTHLAFNAYPDRIDGGGPSTEAVRDPLFRDALGYAIAYGPLIEAALSGHAAPGTTAIPPLFSPFHTPPTNPRRFDPSEAQRRLEAAGYRDRDRDGFREDKEGRTIDLRLFYPTSDPKYAAVARAVTSRWERVGVGVTARGLPSDTLAELLYVPEAGGTADYDVELWGWTGSPDPDFLLSLLTTDQIGVWSDSNYSNPAYDALFDQQRQAPTVEERQAIIRQMLDLAFDEAPYLILFYDGDLHAYRTDRFEGWQADSGDGRVNLFTYGVGAYLDLVAVGFTPTPAPATPTPAAAATPPATVAPTPVASAPPTIDAPPVLSTPILAGMLAVVIGATAVLVTMRLRRGSGP